MRLLLPLLCLLPPLTLAIQLAQVGVVDWHRNHVGTPLLDSPTKLPVFHRVNIDKDTTKSVILTATANNVLAAINPVNGSLVWRHVYEQDDRITTFNKKGNTLAVLSGPGGSTLRVFDVLKGYLLHESRQHSAETGLLTEPPHIGTAISFLSPSSGSEVNPDLLVLTNGRTVRRVHGESHERLWEWTSEDQSSLVIYSYLVVTPTTVYAIGLAKSFASYTLHITTLSTETGSIISDSVNIPSSIQSIDDILTVSSPAEKDADPRALWLEQGSIKSIALTPELTPKTKSVPVKGFECQKILNVGLGEYGQVVAIKSDGTGRVIKLTEEGTLKSIWEFQDSATSKKQTDSMYSGGVDKEGRPYIARVYWSHQSHTAAYNIFSAHLGDGRGLVTGFTFPFDTSKHGIIGHAAIDAANPKDYTVVSRMMLTTSTGAIQLWQQDQLQWNREESLAAISVATFVELPEEAHHASDSKDNSREGFIVRLQRQITDAKDFHHYALSFIRRFTTSSTEILATSAVQSSHSGTLSRDTFGFRQIIVVGTAAGTIYGLDSSNGEILWGRVLGLGWAGESGVGGTVSPVKAYVVKTAQGGEDPEVVIVTQRRAENTLVDTVVFHVNALTGRDARDGAVETPDDVLQGYDIIQGPLVDCFMLSNSTSGSNTLMLLDEFLQIYIYSETPSSLANFKSLAPQLFFPLRSSSAGKNRIMGHQVIFNTDLSKRYIGYPTWTLSLPDDEDVQSIIPMTDKGGRVASVGKVLGNRTTLYKYLNPRLFVLLTSSHKAAIGVDTTTNTKAGGTGIGTCGLYVVDGAKGTIVYRATLPGGEGTICDVKVNLVENWLVYHYYDSEFTAGGSVGMTKGYKIVSVELYEGTGVDDKTRSSDMSSFANETTALTAYERTFIFPHAITALTTSSTRYGITTRDLIYATNNHRIGSIPRRLLNPRRPSRKVTAEEAEEQLITYDPLLPDDPRRVLSHAYDVANVQNILTSPSLLESTSLVFAYGLDLFLSRVSPSNTFDVLSESFNKAQLILTVTGLVVAIGVTRPMVRRKKLRERWYY